MIYLIYEILNVYILYQMNTKSKIITRLKFINEIIQSITKEWMGKERNKRRTERKIASA